MNSLRLLGWSVKLGYCVLRMDSVLMSEAFRLLRSEPDRASRSVDVVLKDRTVADLVVVCSVLAAPFKKGRHLIAVLGGAGRHGGGAGVPGAGRSADPGRQEEKGGGNDGRKEGEGRGEVKEIGGLDLAGAVKPWTEGGRDGWYC